MSFNSRPSCDGRPPSPAARHPAFGFNSRPSCDGRHVNQENKGVPRVSIHARRVTGDKKKSQHMVEATVSIHARRVTGDRDNLRNYRHLKTPKNLETSNMIPFSCRNCITAMRFILSKTNFFRESTSKCMRT